MNVLQARQLSNIMELAQVPANPCLKMELRLFELLVYQLKHKIHITNCNNGILFSLPQTEPLEIWRYTLIEVV